MNKKDSECDYNMQLNSLDEIIEFVIEMDKCKDNFYAIGENAYADAKSILGMIALGIGERFYLVKSKFNNNFVR